MSQDDILNKILTKVIAIKDRINEQMVTKDVFAQKHNEVSTHIDRFVTLHQTLDIKLVALRDKHNRLEERAARVEHKIGAAM